MTEQIVALVPGLIYLTEGGQETQAMYVHGLELPEFAMYPLLDDADAVAALHTMYRQVLEVAAQHEVGVLLGGLDYRASPAWAARLGMDEAQLAVAQQRSIAFLREVAEPYRDRVPSILIAGTVGPRGDAYGADTEITADEAAVYHRAQIATLAALEVDLVEAMTFNSVPEAIGVARAAQAEGMAVSVSFMVGADGRLSTGPTLREAVEAVDAEAGDARPACFGINCSHPFEFQPAITPGPWFERVGIVRPNASPADKGELCQLGELDAGDPQLLARLVGQLASRHPHIQVWGGCCGTWDHHLDLIATAVGAVRAESAASGQTARS